jgi:uncharacterized small protein (DUF1192 family)
MKQQITVEQILDRPTKIIGRLYLAVDELTSKNALLQKEIDKLKEEVKCVKKS